MDPRRRLSDLFGAGCPLYDETRTCTLTPIFVVMLGIAGLGGTPGYRGYLYPALATLLGFALYRLFRHL